jgi:hypothetical protein
MPIFMVSLQRTAAGLAGEGCKLDGKLTGLPSEQDAFDELCGYTVPLRDAAFIHQHAVDAFAAQTADEQTKPIKLTFALVGLYLHIEKGFSGKMVQRAHMSLAKRKRAWPVLPLPEDRGAITVVHVLAAPAGHERDQAIEAWCASVWRAFRDSHQPVAGLLRGHGIV